ncbi:histidine--tRNA ligase [Alsobacter metallidurans]|uniref:Histidine--tRNA ligase n=1 Tax=Alsobacter metallidurans TaxID=340221 RepID=A0A917MGL3_9HYPH|nr:histidine--tRNA ligase [Alsobacter metallidurans]GGH11683.1 histidine--tRNA ligase [Alsobacter metallidurans]
MADTDDTSAARVKARLPRGFADRGPAEIAATERMLAAIRDTFELYGFEAVETPFVEYTEALGKFLPDQDRPNEGVFSFQDDDDQWLSLRYDLTAPLARSVAERFDSLPKPYRSYRCGWVFRNEKPGPGRFRQFMQFDADTVGAPSVAADAEAAMLMADTLEKVGIPRGQYVVKVNNRKVLDGVLEAIGLAGDENAGKRLIVLRAIDKLDKVGPEGVRDLLGPGRMDPSGDFTKGAGLSADAIARVLAFTDAKRDDAAGTLSALAEVVGGSARGVEGVSELDQISVLIRAGGYDDGRVVIDPSVVRGLEYYTGPVYEAELTFEVKDEDGKPVRFGSVAGGGRYDGLVARFRGEPVPATGFSIGVSRLLAALTVLGKIEDKAGLGPVVVLVMDRDQIAHYQGLVAQLRRAGIRSELYLGGAGMKPQMKYADRRGSNCVVIQGSNEREKGAVQVKDLVLGAKLSGAPDRETYLAMQAEAQFEVPEAELVEAVRKVLARHAG